MVSGEGDLRVLLHTLKGDLWPNKTHQYNATLAIQEIDTLAGHSGLFATAMATDQIVRLLREGGNSSATINRKMSFLRTLAKGAFERSLVDRLPIIRRLPESVGNKNTLSSSEIDEVLSTLQGIDRLAYRFSAFLADTGATIGESMALRWSDITHRYVTFWAEGRAQRTIPLTARASIALAFDPTLPKGPFSTVNLKRYRNDWYAAQTRSAVAVTLPPSALRYSCEARLVQSGVDIRTVHEWLGYRTPRSAARLIGGVHLQDAKRVLEATADLPGERDNQTRLRQSHNFAIAKQ
ncbi:hypothetical protein [Aminobacter sp. LjRoot7]|uniref:hypothetical protein n=1 Tax=Aminobacter sp. LjRoot7 TaxID=3342335 RepID=UPI003ECC8714